MDHILPPTLHLICGDSLKGVDALRLDQTCCHYGFRLIEYIEEERALLVSAFKPVQNKSLVKLARSFAKLLKVRSFSLKLALDEKMAHEAFLNQAHFICGSGVRSVLQRTDAGIKKYYFGDMAYLEREVSAREALKEFPEVVPLLAHEDNWMEMPFVDGAKEWSDRGWNLYPLKEVQEVVSFVKRVNEAGYALADWNPGTFMWASGKLHVVDFEYFSTFKPLGEKDWVDLLDGENKPRLANDTTCSYANTWQRVVGLSLEDLDKPLHVLYSKRVIYLLAQRFPKYVAKTLEKSIKSLVRCFKHRDTVMHKNGFLCVEVKGK